MKHLTAINRKAKSLESWALDARGAVKGMAEDETPFGCSTIFGPGWEVDSSGGTYGL